MRHERTAMNFIKKHPYFSSIAVCEAGGFLLSLFYLTLDFSYLRYDLTNILFFTPLTGTFFLYPLLLTGLNLYFFLVPGKDLRFVRTGRHFEYITVCLGFLYSALVLIFYDIQFQADWQETLVNQQVHTPVWTQAYPTVLLLSCVGILGYLLLSLIPLSHMPPLLAVCSISAMYLGVAECALWILQIAKTHYLILCLFPANCILIAAKAIRNKILEYNAMEKARQEADAAAASEKGDIRPENAILRTLNRRLANAAYWPLFAFLLMWPLLGICIGLLVLFGQRPDALIRAFTETSDWNLSTQVSPPNVMYDEHYLCTVAAGGHRRIVRPLRTGTRHGHTVVVNRQLCVANAFEQILEERTPRLHRRIRHLYDTYGFPIARKIRSPYTADLVYILMKPLEYLFLIVLYCCDVNPENRIAVQYPPAGRKP